ncbi:hypothetical protein MC885_003592 [Smutsia gigantea]|nr:hypothetical protein MC885_003592 [Smutsia gigantea]
MRDLELAASWAIVVRSGQKLRKKSTDTAIDDFMTPEEKDKLFTAVGYSESTYNLTLPKQLNSEDQGLQKTTNSSLEEIMDEAYDKFDVEIKNVQLLFARAESDDEYFDAEDGGTQTGKSMRGSELKKVAEVPNEELINVLVKFEIKEVCIFFCP